MREIEPLWNKYELTKLDETNIVEYFSTLLDDIDKKKSIVFEVANRIVSLSPITYDDQYAIKLWNPDYTVIDDIIWNSLWKHMVKDILSEGWYIFLKTFDIINKATHKASIPKEILLDIVRVVFLWEKTRITEKVPIASSKENFSNQIKLIIDIWNE